MFLRYLSDHDYEEEFWPFVFRLETVLAGIVREGGAKIAGMTPDDAYMFLFDSLGSALDPQNGLLPSGWWPEPIPPIEWFDDYLRRETDFILAEAERAAAIAAKKGGNGAETDSDAPPETADSVFDKRKVRECAHRNDAFRRFILPHSDPEDDSHPHHREKKES